MLQANIDKNNKKLDNMHREINRIEKAIRMRRRRGQEHREVSWTIIELKNLKNELEKIKDALKQLISHTEEAKSLVNFKNEELKKKNLPNENLFDFTEQLEWQKEETENHLVLFFELAEENEMIYNPVPINTLIGGLEEMKSGFFTNGYFSLFDEGEIDTHRFF